jgi:hypothetical protein
VKKKLISRLSLVCSLRNAEDCSWMYSGWDKDGNYIDEWMDKATTFLDRAFSWSKIVRCPYSRCQNSRCSEDKRTIAIHLCKNGFVPGYEVWTFNSELGIRVIVEDEHDCYMGVLIGWMRCLKLYK